MFVPDRQIISHCYLILLLPVACSEHLTQVKRHSNRRRTSRREWDSAGWDVWTVGIMSQDSNINFSLLVQMLLNWKLIITRSVKKKHIPHTGSTLSKPASQTLVTVMRNVFRHILLSSVGGRVGMRYGYRSLWEIRVCADYFWMCNIIIVCTSRCIWLDICLCSLYICPL